MASDPRVVIGGAELRFRAGRAPDLRRGPGRTRLGERARLISGAERVHAATFKRFTQRFSRFNFTDNAIRPSYGLAEATLFVASSSGTPVAAVRSTPSSSPPESRSAARGTVSSWSATGTAGLHRAHRRPGDPHRESGRQGRGDLGARRQRCGRLLAKSAGSEQTFGGRLVDASPDTPTVAGCGPEIWVSSATASCSSSAASKIC